MVWTPLFAGGGIYEPPPPSKGNAMRIIRVGLDLAKYVFRGLGSSPNTTYRGRLKPAIRSLHHCISASAEGTSIPSRSATKAQGVSPQWGSGLATTATSRTAGWRASISNVAPLSPILVVSIHRTFAKLRALLPTFLAGGLRAAAFDPEWTRHCRVSGLRFQQYRVEFDTGLASMERCFTAIPAAAAH